MVIVDLEERPAEHLFGRQQVLDVSAVVGSAGVACARGREGHKRDCMRGGPHVDAEGKETGSIRDGGFF